ncbi:MAG: UDP-N-acetylmuramoyl-L-alanyl-D-glutamate--2,6-diaminopimelate ligase [Candidatus Yanofskybacteria bacterium]|nr:UDP-N-acetylmuramoyl-L-alanyl-D-glutamate--2,6-diaminopimelate ligase [Candidatus Yanofskybacteria bacterium]
MFKEGILDTTLRAIKRFIPKRLFALGARIYHPLLAWTGALRYGFPSRKLTVIGVTGTKGKSTVVYLTTKLLEGSGHPVAAIGSLGYKIRDREWPNTLKMTMPGRWKVQRFLRQAVRAGCTHVVMEVPSEGLAQGRHLGVRFDCAVFTNLHPEHIEAHGSFERYRDAKGILFAATSTTHILNADDEHAVFYGQYAARRKLFYGITAGEMRASDLDVHPDRVSFNVYGTRFDLKLGGRFNVSNALAALAVGAMYGVDLPTAKPILERITEIPGRLQWLQHEPFGVVVDYAHTPDSLRAVYESLKPSAEGARLIAVLGAAGGGRDVWKRKEFGALAERYCDRVILTNEDPYDENPERIVEDIAAGISGPSQNAKVVREMDRKLAIERALAEAKAGDVVVITGKGSETSMALAGGKKIPWSDTDIVRAALARR